MNPLVEAWDLWVGFKDFYRWLEDEITEWMVGEGTWMRADEDKCLAGRDGPHPSVGKDGKPNGKRTCDHHYNRLAAILHSIETEAGNLDINPSMAVSFEHGGGGLASQQTPVRLDPLVLNDKRHGRGNSEGEEERRASGNLSSLLDVLGGYAAQVRAEREMAIPVKTWVERMPFSYPGPLCEQLCRHESCLTAQWRRTEPLLLTVKTERQVLSRQLDWIVEQPWRGEFYADMHRLLGQLQRANGTAPPRPLPGKCPALVGPKSDTECGGPLWPSKPKRTVGEWAGSAPSATQCSSCGTRWEGPGALARLALILDQQKRKGA